MRYFRIPINNDVPDIADTDNFDLLFYIGDGKTVYGILIDGVVRPSWEEITEDDFERFTVGEQYNSDQKPTFEETIVSTLNQMQERLIAMEEAQNYLLGLQDGTLVNITEPAETE